MVPVGAALAVILTVLVLYALKRLDKPTTIVSSVVAGLSGLVAFVLLLRGRRSGAGAIPSAPPADGQGYLSVAAEASEAIASAEEREAAQVDAALAPTDGRTPEEALADLGNARRPR